MEDSTDATKVRITSSMYSLHCDDTVFPNLFEPATTILNPPETKED